MTDDSTGTGGEDEPPPFLRLVGSSGLGPPSDDPTDGVSGDFDEHAQRLIPRSVKAALTIVALEALLLALLMAYLISTVIQDVQANSGVTWATMVFTLLMLLGVLAGAMAVLRGRRWGRSPLVAWQVLQLGAAAPSLATSGWPMGSALVALSVIGLATLMSPGVTRHLHWREMPPGSTPPP